MRATTILRFPEESRLYTGSIFRPLLDTKTRIGSQGYVLQGLLTQISRPSRPAICIRNLVHPIPPSLFTCNFVCVDATPEKRVLPASGDTDNQHRWPTHAAGRPQAPPGASLPGGVAVRAARLRRRRAPCLGGSCRRVETPPYKVILGVRLCILCARRGFVPCLDPSHSTRTS